MVVATGALWFRRLNAVRIPENRSAFNIAMAAGVLLGVAALVSGPGLLGGVGAVIALVGGGTFLGLGAASKMDSKEPAVKVGAKILEFTAPDAQGEPFELAKLRGKPFLLKFFRGHW